MPSLTAKSVYIKTARVFSHRERRKKEEQRTGNLLQSAANLVCHPPGSLLDVDESNRSRRIGDSQAFNHSMIDYLSLSLWFLGEALNWSVFFLLLGTIRLVFGCFR